MDPVEINAGTWYLRGLRDDDRVTDRPALADIGITDADFVAASAAGWADGSRCTWAVCEPTTGELWALVVAEISPADTARITGTQRGDGTSLADALPPVRRFITDGLGCQIVT